MEKGFKVLVIDNETGEEIVNEPRAAGFLGVIGNDEDMHSVCQMRCDGLKTVQMIGGMQNLLMQIQKGHPELDALAALVAMMADGKASEEEAEEETK